MSASFLAHRGPIEVRLAETPTDRDQVFQLRHRVLGDSESGLARGLTASNGRLVEVFDSGADLFAAFSTDGQALAAVRRQTLMDVVEADQRYEPLLRVARRLGGNPRKMTVTSRFIIDPSMGGANLALRVFASMLRAGVNEGISHDLCWCDEKRLHGRLRLGYEDAQVRLLDDSNEPAQILSLPVATKENTSPSLVRLVRRVMAA